MIYKLVCLGKKRLQESIAAHGVGVVSRRDQRIEDLYRRVLRLTPFARLDDVIVGLVLGASLMAEAVDVIAETPCAAPDVLLHAAEDLAQSLANDPGRRAFDGVLEGELRD